MVSTLRRMPARVSGEEWQTRCDVSACYRLVDLFGWSDLVNTRITARVPGQHDHFLINPYGLLFDEVGGVGPCPDPAIAAGPDRYISVGPPINPLLLPRSERR